MKSDTPAFLIFLRRNWLALAIALIIAVIVLILALGYRVGAGLTLSRNGTMALEALPAGSVVYVDTARRATASGAGDVEVSMVPGAHTIIVDATGREPWSDLVTVGSGETTRVLPLLVKKSSPREVLTGADALRANLVLKAQVLPTLDKSLMSADGCTRIYVTQNRVVATGTTTPSCSSPAYLCSEGECTPTVIFEPKLPLRSVVLYPNRSDALLLSYSDTLAVVELDPREPQYFAPLYSGVAPTAFSWLGESIGLQDRGAFYSISLP